MAFYHCDFTRFFFIPIYSSSLSIFLRSALTRHVSKLREIHWVYYINKISGTASEVELYLYILFLVTSLYAEKKPRKKSDFLFNFIYEEKKKMKKIFFPLQMYEFCTMKEKRNIKFHKSQNHLWFSSLCQLTLAPASSANVKLYRRAYNRYIIIIFFWRKIFHFLWLCCFLLAST